MEETNFEGNVAVGSLPSEPFQQTPDGKWYCDICSCVQDNKDDLLTHRILHLSDERSKECPLCKKTFSSATTLRNHLTVHTGIKKFRCKFCSRKFGWKTQLAIHENLHTGKGLHHCHICSKSFMTKWLLQRHIKIHDKVGSKRAKHKYHTADKYHESSSEVSVVNKYVERTSKWLKCHECNVKFQSDEELAYHLLSHNSSKQLLEPTSSSKQLLEPISSSKLEVNRPTTSPSTNTNDDSIESESRIKSNIKHQSKGSLTSIVSKLHHKVDEKQKCENENEDNYMNVTLREEQSSKVEANNDFTIDVLSKEGLAKSSDPFISGMTIDNEFTPTLACNVASSLTYHGRSEQDKFGYLRQEICKQNEEINVIKKDMLESRVSYEKELASLHLKIDCLTNLVSSQSLILNRVILGGKMTVSGSLDFTIQQSSNSQ